MCPSWALRNSNISSLGSWTESHVWQNFRFAVSLAIVVCLFFLADSVFSFLVIAMMGNSALWTGHWRSLWDAWWRQSICWLRGNRKSDLLIFVVGGGFSTYAPNWSILYLLGRRPALWVLDCLVLCVCLLLICALELYVWSPWVSVSGCLHGCNSERPLALLWVWNSFLHLEGINDLEYYVSYRVSVLIGL